jgi:hypothetical protein
VPLDVGRAVFKRMVSNGSNPVRAHSEHIWSGLLRNRTLRQKGRMLVKCRQRTCRVFREGENMGM